MFKSIDIYQEVQRNFQKSNLRPDNLVFTRAMGLSGPLRNQANDTSIERLKLSGKENSENKITAHLGCSKTRSDLKCSSAALKEYGYFKNTKDAKHWPLIMSMFYSCGVELLQGACLLNAGLQHSRSSLVFEIRDTFFRNTLFWPISVYFSRFYYDLPKMYKFY